LALYALLRVSSALLFDFQTFYKSLIDLKNMVLEELRRNDRFMLVHHRALHAPLDIGALVDETKRIGDGLRREPVTVLEGDVISTTEGELILTHIFHRTPTPDEYRQLVADGRATSLTETLDQFGDYVANPRNPPVKLCLELKGVTTNRDVEDVVDHLIKRGLGPKDAYFDSFDGRRLDRVHGLAQKTGVAYDRCLHYLAQGFHGLAQLLTPRSSVLYMGVPKHDADFIVRNLFTPYESEARRETPYIRGGVGSKEALEAIEQDPLAIGAYVRFNENFLTMIVNSARNSH
jgi:hypothetical protein